MLRVNAINRQELLKCLTFNPKSLVFKTVSVPCHHNYLDDKQYQSIHTDCEELVKILVTRCKKMDQDLGQK